MGVININEECYLHGAHQHIGFYQRSCNFPAFSCRPLLVLCYSQHQCLQKTRKEVTYNNSLFYPQDPWWWKVPCTLLQIMMTTQMMVLHCQCKPTIMGQENIPGMMTILMTRTRRQQQWRRRACK